LSIRSWLGIDRLEAPQFAPLRETLDALDHLDAERARHLAAFAYLLGRVAHADQHISAEETQTMERLVEQHGGLSHEQAMIVVQLAKTSNLLFGGTANFIVAKSSRRSPHMSRSSRSCAVCSRWQAPTTGSRRRKKVKSIASQTSCGSSRRISSRCASSTGGTFRESLAADSNADTPDSNTSNVRADGS